MLDKDLPFCPVLMVHPDPAAAPGLGTEVPDGYRIEGFRPGDEVAWARIHVDVGQFDTVDAGVRMFRSEFPAPPEVLRTRCYTVRDPEDRVVAVGSLWPGSHFDVPMERIHWIACAPDRQGQGLVKGLVAFLLRGYTQQPAEGLYLVSQTWSVRGINVYRAFGFEPYTGPTPPGWDATDFDIGREAAWSAIDARILAYEERKTR